MTTDPSTLPALSTWYLITNLPRPGAPPTATAPFASADLAELARLYGLRLWVEQSYKQVKGELGWADFQVRIDAAMQRHWQLVCCAFAFCWWAWFQGAGGEPGRPAAAPRTEDPGDTEASPAAIAAGRGKIETDEGAPAHTGATARLVAWPTTRRRARGWLQPWRLLGRCWQAWSSLPPPPELQALLDAVGRGRPLDLYLRC